MQNCFASATGAVASGDIGVGTRGEYIDVVEPHGYSLDASDLVTVCYFCLVPRGKSG
jgi:hypothetical protein